MINKGQKEEDGGCTSPSGDSWDSSSLVHVESGKDSDGFNGESGQTGSFNEQVTEGTDADANSQRRYSLFRQAIGAGLIKRSRPERNGKERGPVTKTTVFAVAILSVSIVLIGISLFPFIFNQIFGVPFYYTNIPFSICDPDVQYTAEDECIRASSDFVWHPGQIVPIVISRCYSNPFSSSDNLTYTFKRRIVNDSDGTQIPIDDSFTSVRKGCSTQRNSLNIIPEKTFVGTWHFEGVSQVVTYKTDEIAWRSVSFLVGP